MGPHEHVVRDLAYSPDGKTLVSAGGDGYVRMWNAADGQLKSIQSDDAIRGIWDLAFAPTGDRVAVVGGFFGKAAVLFDARSGAVSSTIDAPAPPADSATMFYRDKPIDYRILNGVAFSPDGKLLATSEQGVVLHDVATGEIRATFAEPKRGVASLAFSADGTRLAVASEDRQVRIWSVPEGRLIRKLSGATQPLKGLVVFSPDGTRVVAIGSGPRSLLNRQPVGYLWSWQEGNDVPTQMELGPVDVRRVAFVDSQRVAVAAGHAVVLVRWKGTQAEATTLRSYPEDLFALAVSPDGKELAVGGADRTVEVLELETGKLLRRLPGLNDIVSSIAVASDGTRFATATMDLHFSNRIFTNSASFETRYRQYFSGENGARCQASAVSIWSAEDGLLQSILPLPSGQVTSLAFVPRSTQLVVAGWRPQSGGWLSLWDARQGEELYTCDAGTDEILCVAVSPDAQTLVSGDAAGVVSWWNLQDGSRRRTQKFDYPVKGIAFAPDGTWLATAHADRVVRQLKADNGELIRTLTCRGNVQSLTCSGDGRWLAAGTGVPGLELWDLRGDAPSRTLKSPGDAQEDIDSRQGFVCFSADSRFVVCGGKGKDVAVFDVASGDLLGELSGHYHMATAAAFLPDGRLVSGAEERTVRIWAPKSNSLRATWILMPADPTQHWDYEWVGYTPEGEFVGSATLDRLVGWQTEGEYLVGNQAASRMKRVERLFRSPGTEAVNVK
jgi:WD40 repeat protein